MRSAVDILTVQLGDEPPTVAVAPGQVAPCDDPPAVVVDGKLQRVRRRALVAAGGPGEGGEG